MKTNLSAFLRIPGGGIMHSDDWDRLIVGALCHPQGFLHNRLLMMKTMPTHNAENRAGAPTMY
jgi:hypothetical protein